MATRDEILRGVVEAVAESYEVPEESVTEEFRFADQPNNSSSKVLKTALFIGENLDLEDDLEFEDLAGLQTVAEVVDMMVERLG